MTDQTTKPFTDYVLPTNIVSKVDLSRMVREAERVDNEMTAMAVRSKAGADAGAGPTLSDQLRDFLDQNQLKLDENSNARTALIKELRKLKDKAPVIHMTFAVTADGESLQELAGWVRSSVSPQAVIEVGLQPALIGGVYMRTANHVHDFSLRGLLHGGHDLLVGELEKLRGTK